MTASSPAREHSSEHPDQREILRLRGQRLSIPSSSHGSSPRRWTHRPPSQHAGDPPTAMDPTLRPPRSPTPSEDPPPPRWRTLRRRRCKLHYTSWKVDITSSAWTARRLAEPACAEGHFRSSGRGEGSGVPHPVFWTRGRSCRRSLSLSAVFGPRFPGARDWTCSPATCARNAYTLERATRHVSHTIVNG